MNLFIIGNGFDLAHGLKTSYGDFRVYLASTYPGADAETFIMPEVFTTQDGEEEINDEIAVGFMMRLIDATEGRRWRDIETTLGLMDFWECFEDISYVRDSDGDINHWKQVYQNEDIALNLVLPTQRILQYFSDWVGTIEDYDQVQKMPKFARLMNVNEDLFLSFNYTETLQRVYGARNVCHIHGKQGGEILFGHGNDTDYSEDIIDKYIGAEYVLGEIQGVLRKNTAEALRRHEDFFSRVDSRINSVYVHGFSFSPVDLVYIKELCKGLTNPNVVWYLNAFDGEITRCGYCKLLRKCGYKGRFSTFNWSGK